MSAPGVNDGTPTSEVPATDSDCTQLINDSDNAFTLYTLQTLYKMDMREKFIWGKCYGFVTSFQELGFLY